jgi:hypothetical protein
MLFRKTSSLLWVTVPYIIVPEFYALDPSVLSLLFVWGFLMLLFGVEGWL